jgi:dihydroorotase
MEELDLVVRGGRVLDPSSGLDEVLDIGVRSGRIVAIAPDLSDRVASAQLEYPPSTGTTVIDATGSLVVPGLVDMHAHVYTGVCPLTVDADETSSRSGVTTVISAGDAGANTIGGFRRLVVEASRTRVLAFLHISTVGLAGWPEGEAHELSYLDVDRAARAADDNRDIVVGIKVREQAPLIVGEHGLEPLRRAVEAGRRAAIPVMVHIGDSPAPIGDVIDLLRAGDIITHSFTPANNGIIERGRVAPSVRAGRERGVIFDVGHGFGSFSYEVAEIAAAEGFWPDTVSTDLHSLSARGPVQDLPTTMSKFLNLGMALEDVVRAATSRPAEVVGRSRSFGSLGLGSVADIAVLTNSEGPVQFTDSKGQRRIGQSALRATWTIRTGLPWFGPSPHPGELSGSRGYLDIGPGRDHV